MESLPKASSGGSPPAPPSPSANSPGTASVAGHCPPGPPPSNYPPPKVVIAGFGLPGRSVADILDHHDVPYSVIEVNDDVVARCRRTGRHMVCGDARQEGVLREAGLLAADLLALMIPADAVVLDVIDSARKLKPGIQILARAAFTSAGMEMIRRGAADVIVAEQVVANEAARLTSALFATDLLK